MMLEKQPGNLNMEKLQIILLFKEDFNNNNKWLGRAVMFHAEDHCQWCQNNVEVKRRNWPPFSA